MSSVNDLKKKIEELEHQLSAKNIEISQYRRELMEAQAQVQRMILGQEEQVKLLESIQKKLVPTEIPHIPGFEISSKFFAGSLSGGDYFDIFEHQDKMKFGILLADSSGYQISALFLSTLIQFSSRLEAKRGLPPDEMANLMAKELVPSLGANDEISLFYGVVDRRSFEFSCASIGYPIAFLQTKGQGRLIQVEPSAEALSKHYTGHALTQKIQLGPKDRMIFCTRGVSRILNTKSEPFGFERLNQIAIKPRSSVHELRNEILFQASQWSQKTEPTKDQTVIVVEVKDRVIKLAKNQ